MVWLGHSQPVGACQESGADVQDACREYSDLLCASLNQWSHRRSQQQNPRADQKGFWLSEQRTVQERHLFPLGWLGPLSGPMKKHRNIPEEAGLGLRWELVEGVHGGGGAEEVLGAVGVGTERETGEGFEGKG